MVNKQPSTVEGGDNREGNNPRPANRKSHRKAGKNTPEETHKNNDQANLNAIKSEYHGASAPKLVSAFLGFLALTQPVAVKVFIFAFLALFTLKVRAVEKRDRMQEYHPGESHQ